MRILILGIITLLVGAANAQVEIQVDGMGADVSGTTIDLSVDQFTSTPYEISLYVTNNTGADAQWTITREKKNVPATWTDQICWPPSCFPASGDIYETPSTAGNPAPTVVNGSYLTTAGQDAIVKPLINPDGANGIAYYMYYITSGDGSYVDSVGVRYTYTVGIEENPAPLSVSVAPNPANSYFKVQTSNASGAKIQVVDVLGNIVLKETVMGNSKTVSTSNFRNGIYFVKITADKQRPVTRKVIVRH